MRILGALASSRRVALAATLTAVVGVGAGVASCSGDQTGLAQSKLPTGMRSETLEHENCDDSSGRVEALDVNNDGKRDIRTVYSKSGTVLCRSVDLSYDGKPDLFEYYDANGVIRRREYCYDDTGIVNAIDYYEGGKLVRREYDTTGLHKIDTWDFYDPNGTPDPKTGRMKPIRRERDTTGDGKVDQWWTWDGDKLTIAFDKNGDGKPDPEDTITLGGDAAAAAASAPPPPANADAGAPVATNDEAGAPSAVATAGGDAGALAAGPTDAGADGFVPRNQRVR
jgi:hypothetical protein